MIPSIIFSIFKLLAAETFCKFDLSDLTRFIRTDLDGKSDEVYQFYFLTFLVDLLTVEVGLMKLLSLSIPVETKRDR